MGNTAVNRSLGHVDMEEPRPKANENGKEKPASMNQHTRRSLYLRAKSGESIRSIARACHLPERTVRARIFEAEWIIRVIRVMDNEETK